MEHDDVQEPREVSVPVGPASTVTQTSDVERGKVFDRRRVAVIAAILVAALGALLVGGLLLNAAAARQTAEGHFEEPSSFDPLRRTLHIGWVPPNLTESTWNLGGAVQQFGGRDSRGRTGDGLVVTVWVRGMPIPEHGGVGLPTEPEEHPTAPINGHAAWCIAEKGVADSCHALKWQYRPDSWAEVAYAGALGPDEASAAAVARRVAGSVSLTANEPVRLPFRLSGQAAKLYVLETMVGPPSDAAKISWAAGVTLTDGKGGSYGENVRIIVHGVPGRMAKDRPANATVDGHQARRAENSILVWGVRGTRLSIEVNDRPWDPEDFYPDIQWPSDPVNYSTWPVYRQ